MFVFCALVMVRPPAHGETVLPLKVAEIAQDVFVAQGAVATANPGNKGHIANVGFIIGNKYVAVIDTGGSIHNGLRLRQAIRAKTDLPIRYVINTHMHPDHVLGNAAFQPDQPDYVGHRNLTSALGARAETYLKAGEALIGKPGFAGTRIITPTIPVSKAIELDLGDRTIRLTPMKTAHTDNDLVIVDLQTRTAWLGDLLFVEHLPVIDGSLNGWLGVLEQLVTERYAFVVPGHGKVSRHWPGIAEPQRDYLLQVQQKVRKFIADGHTLADALSEIAPPDETVWKLSPLFHRRNVSAAFAELEWE